MPRGGSEIVAEAAKRFCAISRRMPRRLHITHDGNLSLDSFIDEQEQPIEKKPKGLWYGIDDDWLQWCYSNQSDWIGPYFYEIVLDESRLLSINNLEAFDQFEKAHVGKPEWMVALQQMAILGDDPLEKEWGGYKLSLLNEYSDSGIMGKSFINYGKVALSYGAMEVTPYLHKRRLSSMWYYGWDCASGCVWEKKAIKKIKLFAHFNTDKGEFVKV